MTKINFFIFLRQGPSVDLSGLGGTSQGLVSLFVPLSQLTLPVWKGSVQVLEWHSLPFNRYQVLSTSFHPPAVSSSLSSSSP